MEQFTQSLSWIKDLTTIAFYTIGTTLAILTYKRAKATVLQPKRSEVIKIQTEVLTDFLSNLNTDGNTLDSSLDYVAVHQATLFYRLLKTGLPADKSDPDFARLMQDVSGWYAVLKDGKAVQMKGSFGDLPFYEEHVRPVAIIVLTKKALENINRIITLQNHPFIPDEIGSIAGTIMKKLSENYFEIMLPLLTPVTVGGPAINSITSMEEFSKRRHHHDQDAKALREAIRKHLGINDKW